MDTVVVFGVAALVVASMLLVSYQRSVWRQFKEMRRRYEADHQRRLREMQAMLEECACAHEEGHDDDAKRGAK